jgi:hypothetical protein
MTRLTHLGLVLVARLAFASAVAAQDDVTARPVPHGLEIGGSVGAIWFEPTVGVLASVRASPRSSVEGGVNMTPYFVVAQTQVRVRLPFGPAGGARRSLVVGLTHTSRRTTTTKGGLQTGFAAHGGLSAQAPLSRHVDLRADVQMAAPFRDGPDADLRAAVAVVWHP